MTESDGIVAVVTGEGRVTIPRRIRDKLDIDTPGRVRFVEHEDGEIMVKAVKRPSELRGALTTEEIEQETSATEMLREDRQRDKG
ncbi:AbrB/MazE/SpoVT family DNA-binding domain-containing protein [Halorubrum sp. FL23]|uniref:AbrB/MazE/SpoVT family DNA-binding domain-containing protein n=1 Tax=Halorubrum sp. FL23 TaxID=3458704 RepID=UPI004034B6E8